MAQVALQRPRTGRAGRWLITGDTSVATASCAGGARTFRRDHGQGAGRAPLRAKPVTFKKNFPAELAIGVR